MIANYRRDTRPTIARSTIRSRSQGQGGEPAKITSIFQTDQTSERSRLPIGSPKTTNSSLVNTAEGRYYCREGDIAVQSKRERVRERTETAVSTI